MINECSQNGLFQDLMNIILTSRMAFRELDDDDDDDVQTLRTFFTNIFKMMFYNVLSHETVISRKSYDLLCCQTLVFKLLMDRLSRKRNSS